MIDTFKKSIRVHGMLDGVETVLVALSGGADSVALLMLMPEAQALPEFGGFGVSAAHINHNLRGDESDADEEFVRELCAELNVPLQVFSVDVAAQAEGLSPEEAARNARYSRLYESAAGAAGAAAGAAIIATAHNQNDNAETVLLNLCRGTGLKGLGGIPPVRCGGRGAVTIIRPLLNTPRSEIECYLRGRNIAWRNDRTNIEEKFLRNKIRHKILPELADINPNIIAAISDMTEILREEEEFLDTQAAAALETCRDTACRVRARRDCNADKACCDCDTGMARHAPTIILDLPRLLAREKFLQHRIIRLAIARHTTNLKNISRRHIEDILALSETGKTLYLPGNLTVTREYDRLKFQPVTGCNRLDSEDSGGGFYFALIPDKPVFIPTLGVYALLTYETGANNSDVLCTKYFNCDRINGTLAIRSRRMGDSFGIKNGRKKLNKELNGCKIAASVRDSVPLLAYGSEILWVMHENGRTAAKFKPQPGCRLFAVRIYGAK